MALKRPVEIETAHSGPWSSPASSAKASTSKALWIAAETYGYRLETALQQEEKKMK